MLSFLTFIFGLAIGSFLNVCIYRLPKSESVVSPRSHCPHCGHLIPWYDNIPVISFLLLKGRCRFCKKRISFRYLIVELLTATVLTLMVAVLGMHLSTAIFIVLVCALIAATFIDFEYQIIPDEITYGGMVLGLALSFIFPQLHHSASRIKALSASGSGLFVGGLSIYLTGVIGKLIFRKEAMGGGDVKLLAMIGSFVGFKNIILIYFLAPFFGSVVGIYMKLRYKAEIVPYGPYLSLASLVVILWGDRMLRTLFPYY